MSADHFGHSQRQPILHQKLSYKLFSNRFCMRCKLLSFVPNDSDFHDCFSFIIASLISLRRHAHSGQSGSLPHTSECIFKARIKTVICSLVIYSPLKSLYSSDKRSHTYLRKPHRTDTPATDP